MVPLPVGRTWLASRIVLAVFVASVSSVSAQDEPKAKQLLEFMQAAVGSLETDSSELRAKAALAVGSKPLLRYSDATRGALEKEANVLLDASVWRLRAEGRPTALVTVEIYQSSRTRLVSFEFLSLTEAKFSLKHKTEKVRWDATGSALDIKELPDAPKPGTTPVARLAQMRLLARRFVVKELYNKELIECRLLTQPIDRYESAAEKIVDGAIFAFANGTNPEIGLLLESDGERWRYGIVRLSAAESTVTLDGRQVAAFEFYATGSRTDGPYSSSSYKIEMSK